MLRHSRDKSLLWRHLKLEQTVNLLGAVSYSVGDRTSELLAHSHNLNDLTQS